VADVKWIKIVTDIFDDEKIQVIESMPEGDTVALLWFKLLCLAGKVNHNGFLMLTERIAYTEDMLSAVFRRDVKLVRLALNTFVQMGMIEITENTMHISNWNKYQNAIGLEEIREKGKLRQQRYRESQKLLTESTEIKNVEEDTKNKTKNKRGNVDSNVTRNVTSTDDARFGEFWTLYPKKIGRKAACASWKRVKVTAELHDKILSAVRLQQTGAQWQKENGRFIPNPATWLNQGRWDDEIQKAGTTCKIVLEQQYNQREYSGKDYETNGKYGPELSPEEIEELKKYGT
jgi:predicted phage replisome organizer